MFYITDVPIDQTLADKGTEANYQAVSEIFRRLGWIIGYRSLMSDDYVPLTSGFRMWYNETAGEWQAEFQTIIAGTYIKTFVANIGSIPTSEHIGDLWIVPDNNNKIYRAASVGADEITAGEWVEYGTLANWSELVDDDSNKPDDNATAGATFGDNISGGGSANSQVSDAGYSSRYLRQLFGDGNDGNVTISSDTTLTADMYYNNLTINSGYTLNTGGYRIFVKNTLTNNGTIQRDGNAGSEGESSIGGWGSREGGDGGAVLAIGTLYGGSAGEKGGSCSGGTSDDGVVGDTETESYGSNGSEGGAGGNSYQNNIIGGAGGGAGVAIQTIQPIRSVTFATIMREFSTDNTVKYIRSSGGSGSGGSGGGYGGSYTGTGGGGSGSSGGIVLICAHTIINNSGKIISVKGGNGGNGGDASTEANSGGGGGGAGGSGGILVLIYNSLTNNGSISVAGGTGGSGGPGGASGGDAGIAGTNGNAGTLIQLEV